MDTRFNEQFTDPFYNIFKVVFYPDRVYHAQYLNATRSPRYRYNVTEVRNVLDMIVMKAEVYLDGAFLSNVLRIEYRAGRLTEVAREKERFLRDQVIGMVRLWDPSNAANKPMAFVKFYFDKWINAYQAEIWETVDPPAGKYHDFKVLDQMGRLGAITSVFQFKDLIHELPKLKRLELAFRENDINLPFGYNIGDPVWDNAYLRNHQEPNTAEPSSPKNTVEDNSYLVDFQRGWFLQANDVEPVRYRNAMMDQDNPAQGDDNVIEMRWVLQREFASSVVFFHQVTIPPGTTEGTHRHIGTEELYYIVQGTGIAYMGDGDDPDTANYPLVDQNVYGFGVKKCRELKVRAGNVIYTKSGGIHGIKNTGKVPLKFAAFLYHTS
jgi:mannose-6-phosphate isomerase-like protein (cupin superfamily)